MKLIPKEMYFVNTFIHTIYISILVLISKFLFPIVGCCDGNNIDCIGKDLALLGNCNHTITTHGTYGHWAAFLAGGEVYTEFGPIIPDAHA